MTHYPQIPLCRAEFLQDISIELGRQFAAAPFRRMCFDHDTCEYKGETLERLTFCADTHYGTGASLTLWDNGMVWVSVILWPAKNNGEYSVGFYPKCEGFESKRIAELFRDTVSVSNRLCYNESPLPTLRQLWKHTGEVKTEGTLNAQPRALQNGGPGKAPEQSSATEGRHR
jgi:hypothetical protein